MRVALTLITIVLFSVGGFETHGQTEPRGPVVKKINEVALKQLLKPGNKPLLVNFWATWCDPCRDEFPDLVKLDREFKGKIDFITVSLDYAEDIPVKVPQFLQTMKAEMPTYVLITNDETAAINGVFKHWKGGLPFTILYDPSGETVFVTQKVLKLPEIRPRIEQLLGSAPGR
jgi:thiol-disulfide isomerase/thioredoxin